MNHPLTNQIIASLGDCEGENEYLIKNVNGSFWIEHKHVGSGEPLEQFLDEQIEKYEKVKKYNANFSTLLVDEVKRMENNLDYLQSILDNGLGKSPLEKMEIELQKIKKDK